LEKEPILLFTLKSVFGRRGPTSRNSPLKNMIASIIATACCSQLQMQYQKALNFGHPTSSWWQKFTKIVGKSEAAMFAMKVK